LICFDLCLLLRIFFVQYFDYGLLAKVVIDPIVTVKQSLDLLLGVLHDWFMALILGVLRDTPAIIGIHFVFYESDTEPKHLRRDILVKVYVDALDWTHRGG
jgi:hypothetical protein